MAGQRSNQLNYVPTCQINQMQNLQCLCGFAGSAYNASLSSAVRNRPILVVIS